MYYAAVGSRRVRPQDGHGVQPVLYRVQRPAAQQQAVAFRQRLAVQVHPAGLTGRRVDAEQRAGVGLHDDQATAIRCRRDAVGVEAGAAGAAAVP